MTPRPPAPERVDGPARFQAPLGPQDDGARSPLRAAGAAAALAVLLLGVPAALLWLAGPLSWPGSLPGLDELSGSIGVEQVLAVLLVVAWLAWAQFALCVIVEVAAARRGGVLAAPLPLSGPSQRLARTLVASVLVAGTIAIQTGTAFAAADVPPVQPSIRPSVSTAAQAITSPGGIVPAAAQTARPAVSPSATRAAPGYVEAATAGPAVSGVPSGDLGEVELVSHHLAASHDVAEDDAELDGQKVYVVLAPSGRHHDSLWEIAERHLGDGRRYKEIYDLNHDRRQPDGRTLHLARLIQPGWQLVMPDDATGVHRYVSASRAQAPQPTQTAQGDPDLEGASPTGGSGTTQGSANAASGAVASRPAGPGTATAGTTARSSPELPGSQTAGSAAASARAGAAQSARAAAEASAEADDEAAAAGRPLSTDTPAATTGPAAGQPSWGLPGEVGAPLGLAAPGVTPASPGPRATASGPDAGAGSSTPDAHPSAGGVPSGAGTSSDVGTSVTPLPGEVAAAAPPLGMAAPGVTRSGDVTADSITPDSRALPPAAEASARQAPASAPAQAEVRSSARPATQPAQPDASARPAQSTQPDASARAVAPSASSAQPAHSDSSGRPAETASVAAPSEVAPATGGRSVGTKGGWPGADLLGAGLLGAALLSALLLVRRRRGGATSDDPAAEAEVWLRAGADKDRNLLLDRALRSIGAACAASRVPLPQVYGAVVDHEGIDLLLSAPQPGAPAPWRDVSGGARWRVEGTDGDRLTGDGPSAYPLLASVGRDDQGRDALINLGAAGGPITVLGSPAMASAVVRALALSLAGSAWSRGIEVLTCDLPASLPAISAGRLVSCPSAEDLTDQLESGNGPLPRSGPAQVLTGGPAPGSRPERVAVYGEAPPPAVTHRIEDLARSGISLAVLMTGELAAARWRLRVDDTGRLTCEELSLAVTAHRLGDGSLERLHSLFTAASQPGPRPVLADDEHPSLPRPSVESDDIAWAQASARLALLGEVEVRAPGSLDDSRTDLAAELVAYLALHPAGSHPTVLGSAIWPRGVTSDVRDATIEQVRDWMGTDPDGQYRVRTGHDGRVRLSPAVICDWDVLRTLLARARQAPAQSRERDLLVRALHLVRGPVAGGPVGGSYSWLARTDLEHQAEALIIDAADRLSQICVEDGDHVGVAQAAAAGLRARPDAQQLWRHILRAEFALGGAARLHSVVEHLIHALRAEGVDMEPQTQALIDHLLAPTGSLPTTQHHSAS